MKLFNQWLHGIPTSLQYTFRDSGDSITIGGALRKGDIVRPLTKDNTGDSKVGRIDELSIRPSKKGALTFTRWILCEIMIQTI